MNMYLMDRKKEKKQKEEHWAFMSHGYNVKLQFSFFHVSIKPAGMSSLLALMRKDSRNREAFVVQDQYSPTVGRLESLSSIICHFEM